MILSDNREQVIENIRRAAEAGRFYSKVETGDPALTVQERTALLDDYCKMRSTRRFMGKRRIARLIAGTMSRELNRTAEITGLENVKGIDGGAIVTSNHFSPVDNTLVRALALKQGKKKLCIVSQDANLAMPGWVGFLMRYADTLPIGSDFSYMTKQFEPCLGELLGKKEFVLIYPEQEMWFNYRKPRPPKRGAYYYAAKFRVPVISCFVEMQDLTETETLAFHKVKYILHILPAIFPDPAKTVRENSVAMSQQDYRQKKAAYEAAYGKPLDYRFEPEDIAGWIPAADTEPCDLLSAESKMA